MRENIAPAIGRQAEALGETERAVLAISGDVSTVSTFGGCEYLVNIV